VDLFLYLIAFKMIQFTKNVESFSVTMSMFNESKITLKSNQYF